MDQWFPSPNLGSRQLKMGTSNNIFKYEEISIVDTDDITIVSTK